MRIRYVGLALGLALLSCVDQGIAAPPPPPAAVFVALPAIRNVALSPGGKMLAWFDSTSGAERIVMYDIVAQKECRVLGVEPQIRTAARLWAPGSAARAIPRFGSTRTRSTVVKSCPTHSRISKYPWWRNRPTSNSPWPGSAARATRRPTT